MKITEHIERAKAQPHHVKKRITFGVAGAAAGLVAVAWLGVSLSTGAFAIHPSNFAAATEGATSPDATAGMSASQLAGVAAAAQGSQASAPAHIEIVDASTTPATTTQPTVIPF